ncbi:alpha/beta hydrolase fold domain-containing protein, partial [Kibdelosporangium lantanae]
MERDITYTGDLRLDVYHAQDAPVVVYVHGGGWTRGDKATDGAKRLAPLSAYGVTVVAVDYTLSPAAVFPQQLDELRAAVQWVRANLPGSERVGIWGASAGAYLGSLLALSTEDVQAVVHWFGQADLVAS